MAGPLAGCRGDPPPPRRDRRQRLVGPVRVDLSASALAAASWPINGRNGCAGRPPRGVDHDQAAGAAVPRAVRGLVLGDRRPARASSRPPSSGRRGRRAVAAVPRRRRSWQTTCATSPTTRATSSTSCRSEPGTCGGSSSPCSRVASFVADDVAFLGPVTLPLGRLRRHRRPRAPGRRRRRSCATRGHGSLILGLAAATLVAFCFLTSMHERYAFGGHRVPHAPRSRSGAVALARRRVRGRLLAPDPARGSADRRDPDRGPARWLGGPSSARSRCWR